MKKEQEFYHKDIHIVVQEKRVVFVLFGRVDAGQPSHTYRALA